MAHVLESATGIPELITQKNLIRGHSLNSLNLIPHLQIKYTSDDNPNNLTFGYNKLCKIRNYLIKQYNEEFLTNLVIQAVDKLDGYVPVKHIFIDPGDLILIKEQYAKMNNYPPAVVKQTAINSSNEVPGALSQKESNHEIVKRHASKLISFLNLNRKSYVHIKNNKSIKHGHNRPKTSCYFQ